MNEYEWVLDRIELLELEELGNLDGDPWEYYNIVEEDFKQSAKEGEELLIDIDFL